MFWDVPGCSGMFRHVPECSMFLVLSTPETNNMHENYAHGEQGLHRFPPQFNFYHCTNVQVHNNISGSG